jgi:hypothetical protein
MDEARERAHEGVVLVARCFCLYILTLHWWRSPSGLVVFFVSEGSLFRRAADDHVQICRHRASERALSADCFGLHILGSHNGTLVFKFSSIEED